MKELRGTWHIQKTALVALLAEKSWKKSRKESCYEKTIFTGCFWVGIYSLVYWVSARNSTFRSNTPITARVGNYANRNINNSLGIN